MNCKFTPPPLNRLLIFYIVLILVIATGIILRIKVYLFNQSFWLDEMLLGMNIDRPFLKLFNPLAEMQVAPPFFLCVSKFFLLISGKENSLADKDLILRLLPFLSSVFALPLFAFLAHKMYNNKIFTLVSVSIISFNATAINYSQEFKQYSTEMFFSILLLYVFYSVNFKSIKNLCFSSFIFCLAPWFSSSSFIILASGFLFLLIKHFKDKKILILILPFLINALLYYFLYYRRVRRALYDSMFTYWSISLPSFFSFDNFYDLFVSKTQGLINFCFEPLLFFLLILCIMILFSEKNFKKIILILFPVILCIVFAFLGQYPYERRLILFLLPCFALLFSQFVLLLKETKKTNFVVCTLIAALSFIRLSAPADAMILAKSYTRNLYQIYIHEDPDLKNNLVITYPDLKYYMKNIPNEENIWEDFSEITANKIKTQCGENTCYALISIASPEYNKSAKIKEFVLKSYKHVQIWESPYNKNIYLIKFKKERK